MPPEKQRIDFLQQVSDFMRLLEADLRDLVNKQHIQPQDIMEVKKVCSKIETCYKLFR